jgi:hypothetical protein
VPDTPLACQEKQIFGDPTEYRTGDPDPVGKLDDPPALSRARALLTPRGHSFVRRRRTVTRIDRLRPRSSMILPALCAALLLGAPGSARAQDQQSSGKSVEVAIYPLLVQAPIFGATVDLPSIGGGGEEGEQSGSTDYSLNSAYMAGLTVRGRQWFGEARGTWADVSASFEAPRLQVESNATLFNARGGVRLADGLFVTGGLRRVALTLDTQISLPSLGISIQGTAKPVLWDPLIGVDWRHRMGRWIVDGNFEGGGFGVGTDVDLSGEVHANWRGIPHTEIRLGFEVVYFKLTVDDVNIGSFQRTLVSSQTMYGPIVGFGFFF